MSSSVWAVACLLPFRYWPGSQVNVWGTCALLTALLGHTPIWPLIISWCSSNSNSVRTGAISAPLVNILSQAASITAASIYRMDDKPFYHRGNTVLIQCAFATIAAYLFAKIYYIPRNKFKDAKWNKMTLEEQERCQLETADKGNTRLDFRFVH